MNNMNCPTIGRRWATSDVVVILCLIAAAWGACGRSSNGHKNDDGSGDSSVDSAVETPVATVDARLGETAAEDGGADTTFCGEPISCEGYDDGPDAHIDAVVTCLSPGSAPANSPLSLAIYGHHLATGPNDYAIVIVGNSTLNGVPVTACHLQVEIPASAISARGQVSVEVHPGGWTGGSKPAQLTLR
jgi:hypothetical protein